MGIIFLMVAYAYVMVIAYVLCAVLGTTAVICGIVWGVRYLIRKRKEKNLVP